VKIKGTEDFYADRSGSGGRRTIRLVQSGYFAGARRLGIGSEPHLGEAPRAGMRSGTCARVSPARAGAAWRSVLGIAEPSPPLGRAIASLSAMVEAVAPADGTPSFDAVLAASREVRVGERSLDDLVRSALRATLEQLRSRQPGTGG
jgi:hypothetical protein